MNTHQLTPEQKTDLKLIKKTKEEVSQVFRKNGVAGVCVVTTELANGSLTCLEAPWTVIKMEYRSDGFVSHNFNFESVPLEQRDEEMKKCVILLMALQSRLKAAEKEIAAGLQRLGPEKCVLVENDVIDEEEK